MSSFSSSRGEVSGDLLAVAAARAAHSCVEHVLAAHFAQVSKVGRRVFDDSKVTDHFAIVPTLKGMDEVG